MCERSDKILLCDSWQQNMYSAQGLWASKAMAIGFDLG